MLFRELNRGKCKTYLVACEETRRAAIVDPLKEKVDRYLAVLAYHGCTLDLVVDTHTHADHRTGTWELHDLTAAPVVMHRRAPAPHVDVHVEHGERLAVGRLGLLVLHTPGHTADGISLHVGDRVLTGDTLLIHGTGRADFAGGDPGVQYDSITQRLFALPDETIVLPAHDYRGHTQSTIGEEKRTNPRLAGRSREQYVALMNGLGLPLPEGIQEALQANQSAIEDDSVRFPPLSRLSEVRQMGPHELHVRLTTGTAPVVLDVREPDELHGQLGHVAGSLLIPLRELPSRIEELATLRDRPVVVVCRAGVRSATAAAILTASGFEQVWNLRGGMLDWNEERLPVER
jgi:glyoxylase-like metal-dependent hydrolase (beta-lactamase superfamily II)/rhodanese-related sulfurtransferase